MSKEDSARMLVKSLDCGNIQQVTLEIAGKEQKIFIEAKPQYKTVHFIALRGNGWVSNIGRR